MEDYVERIINELPIKISNSDMVLTPSGSNIFEKGNSKSMGKKETGYFHTSVARGMSVAKIDRPNIRQTVVMLSNMVK